MSAGRRPRFQGGSASGRKKQSTTKSPGGSSRRVGERISRQLREDRADLANRPSEKRQLLRVSKYDFVINRREGSRQSNRECFAQNALIVIMAAQCFFPLHALKQLLIRQVFRAFSVAGATLENQQHGPVAADRVIEVHFRCVELAGYHIRSPDIRLPDMIGSWQEKSSDLR